MTRTRIVALITVIVMILSCFTSCNFFKKDKGDKNDGIVNGGEVTPPADNKCHHTSTTLVGEKEATCAENGYTGDTVCTACTAIVVPGSVTPKLDHAFDEGEVTKNPTCISTGVKTFTCSGCGTTKNEAIATLEHDSIYHDAQDGTHFHTCNTCTLNEQGEHTPTDAGIFVEANCTEPSHTIFICAECDGEYKVYNDNDTALDHNLSDWTESKTATCVSNGRKSQVCTREGCDYSHSVNIPANGIHNFVFSHYISAPLCNADGVALYVCKNCTSTEERAVSKTGVHNYVQLENTGDGWIRKQCSACNDLISSFDASTLKEAAITTNTINKNEALEVNVESAAIQFPQEVVGQIASGSDVSVSAGILDEEVKSEAIDKVADEEQKALLENANIYDFTVKVDGETFRQNFDNKVAITLSYDNGDGDAEGIVIYYLAESGEIETITDVVYNPETKEVTFFVSHFSYYAVAYKETQSMRCNRGLHDYVATDRVYAPTCYSFGYTVYKCSCCERETVDDMVARIPHRYGDEIAAHPGCDRADYITRVCQNEGCNDVLKVKLVGATGHKIKNPATCEDHAVCQKCGEIVTLAFGHNWTAWEIVIEPTAVKNGLRRRYCTNCGQKEESELAASGNIETIEYNSYDELLEVLLTDVLKISSGKLNFCIGFNEGKSINLATNIMKTDNGHRVYVAFTQDLSTLEVAESYDLYYDNGVFVLLTDDVNSFDGGIADLDGILGYLPIDELKAQLEYMYTELDVVVEDYLSVVRDFLESYLPIYGDEINKILKYCECDYDVHELIDTIDSIETVYAYLSLRLGYASAQQMVDGVVLPNREDIRRFLDAFMTVTEENGITIYDLSSSTILDEASKVLEFFEERLDYTVAEFIYEAIDEYALEIDPSLTSFNAVMEYIEKEFPGSFTVADAINKYIDFAKKEDLVSIKSLYSLADTIAREVYNQEIDSEKLVKKNRKMTLNELVRKITGSDDITVQDFYDQLASMAHTTKFGDLSFRDATIAKFVEAGQDIVDQSPITAGITLRFDADGRLIDLVIDGDFDGEEVNYNYIDLSIIHDDTVKVDIPAEFKDVMKAPTSSFDKDGNLIVSDLPDMNDTEFDINGNAYVPLKEIVTKDDKVSEQKGEDVYVLGRDYWTSTSSIGYYISYNGKYYQNYKYRYIFKNENYTTLDAVIEEKLNEYKGSLYDTGYTLVGRSDVAVYSSNYFHNLISYEKDGVRYYSDSYYRTYEGYCVYEEFTEDQFDQLMKVTTSSSSTSYYVDIDGELVPLTTYYTSGGDYRYYYGYEHEGTIRVFNEYNNSSSSCYVIDLAGDYITELPEHDYMSHYSHDHVYVENADGSLLKLDAEYIYIYRYAPSYFYKISDDYYININSYYHMKNVSVDGLEEINLPDGNTLYVIGTNGEHSHGKKKGYQLAYGYVKVTDDFFIQTIAGVKDGKVIDFYYRDASSTLYYGFGNLNIDQYSTKNPDGSYTLSAEIINKLNSFCREDGYYNINLNGELLVGGRSLDVSFGVTSYANTPRENNDDISYNTWYDLFENNYDSPSAGYEIEFNNNGSISLIFPNGTVVSDIYYYSSLQVSVEDQLKYDQSMSDSTGFDIYAYTNTYESYTYDGSYLYVDGKYYNYSYYYVYDFDFIDDPSPDGWYINNMTYRFDTVGAKDLPAQVPVYQTEIYFYHNYNNYYYNRYITIYTIVVDGEIYALTQASVTGESLLTFEGWMPLKDYMAGLEFVADLTANDYSHTVNHNGQDANVYTGNIRIYETDGEGNRLSNSYRYTINAAYMIIDGDVKYICGYNTKDRIRIVSEADLSHIPAGATTDSYTSNYDGITYEFVRFEWKQTQTFTAYYIKLAGSYYRYDYVYNNIFGGFRNEAIDQYQFKSEALSKVWYYKVVDSTTGEARYYTEFIPSDYGFSPSGVEVSVNDISGSLYSEVILGYTSDGNPLYEVAYWVDESSGSFEYTSQVQADGTVFLHRDGIGYLKVTGAYGSVYYVEARRVTNADGTSEIICLLMGPNLTSSESRDYGKEILKSNYVQIKGNELILKKKMVAAILSDYNGYGQLNITLNNGSTYYIDYHDILSWFNSN